MILMKAFLLLQNGTLALHQLTCPCTPILSKLQDRSYWQQKEIDSTHPWKRMLHLAFEHTAYSTQSLHTSLSWHVVAQGQPTLKMPWAKYPLRVSLIKLDLGGSSGRNGKRSHVPVARIKGTVGSWHTDSKISKKLQSNSGGSVYAGQTSVQQYTLPER